MNNFAKHILSIILASLLIRILYLALAFFITGDSNIFSFDGFAGILHRNDAGWFERIAENWYPVITDLRDLGYSHDAEFKQSEWAFFPMYPLMNRVLMQIFNIPFLYSGLFLSLALSFLTFIGFYWFCLLHTGDNRKSLYCSLVFIVFPFHYYFSMMYTEAAFFTFLIYTFIVVHKKVYWIIPLLLIPLVLSRPFGLVSIIAIYMYHLEREGILKGWIINFNEFFKRSNLLKSLLFLSGPLAFAMYCAYQYQMTGVFNAFTRAQAGWYREMMFPWMAFFRSGDFPTQFSSFYSIIVILLSVLTIKKHPASLNVFIWLSIILPLVSGSVASMPRFVSVIFPITILIGSWLYKLRTKYAFIALFAGLQIFVFYYWLIGDPFSF